MRNVLESQKIRNGWVRNAPVVPYSEFYELAMMAGLCINCLNSGNHFARNCLSGTCSICSKKHNSILHEAFENAKDSASSGDRFPTENVSGLTTANYAVANKTAMQAMLSTVAVDTADNEGKWHKCRALLDSVSHADFITEQLAKKLRLKEKRVEVSVVGMGQQTLQSKGSVQMTIKSRLGDYKIDTQAFIKTKFGWVIGGGWNAGSNVAKRYHSNLASIEDLGMQLNKFWEMENVESVAEFNPEERYCLELFNKTTKRDREGRFIVELPVKGEKLDLLGKNRENAFKRFLSLERRLQNAPNLKEDYVNFMREYSQLGHMKEIDESHNSNSLAQAYYIPHNCVINEKSTTTRLRVVFDASAKSQTGYSLNDVLMTGPVLQDDLFSIPLRYRMFRFVMTADIKKMFRQVRLVQHQTSPQRIFWRERPSEKVKIFELQTVTYETAPASFLAINSVRELAKEQAVNYPVGAKIALRDFYVDDLITGANTKEELFVIKGEIVSLLKKGGLELAKWASNVKELMDSLTEVAEENITFDRDNTTRTLGIIRNQDRDLLTYTVPDMKEKNRAFKRFTARRGPVKNIFSDNGTKFVGASRTLDDINWHFIPPRTPNFGGLWEAAVKSFKRHWKRVIGEVKLTYDEFNRLAIQIEAILNSRPLTPISDDINDYSFLTPSHFLNGDIRANVDDNRLTRRWQMLQQLRKHFWERWRGSIYGAARPGANGSQKGLGKGNIALHLKEQEDQSTEHLLKALNKRAKIERELTRERGDKLRTEGNASTSRTKCLLRSGTNHRTYHCRRGTPEERRTAALKAELCLKCLQRGHKSKECPGKGTCTGCKGDHHPTICGKGRRINAMSEEDEDVPIKEMELLNC
ncbi:UNVERIFIED_CONTAM: hypothetical protein PYX00_007582 [Menopon gallinae]|uniref:CCHC-type domain-containing protein n=1 Tax=Menopon gallinae TaxID=328185 RepID=A0AAW2HJX0_9NEOP